MKRILTFLLSPSFGSRRFRKFYEVLKNFSFLGLNYRNINMDSNGELFYMRSACSYLSKKEEPIVLFDVGANIGNYSRALGKVFDRADKTIYSFEPFSMAFEKLKTLETEIKGFRPFRLGFSDKKEQLSFLSSEKNSEVGSLYDKDFSSSDFVLDITEKIEFDTIDNFCESKAIQRIHFLKVDVEGHDFFVLKGAKSLLDKGAIDFIQFEFGHANYLSKTYLYDFFQLLSTNYRIYKTFRNGFYEIKSYNTDIEIHILSNYVAVRKDLHYEL